MKFTNIRIGDTVRYKGTLYEVMEAYDGKFGIMRTDIDARNMLWVEVSQLIKVLDKEEFGEKCPEE